MKECMMPFGSPFIKYMLEISVRDLGQAAARQQKAQQGCEALNQVPSEVRTSFQILEGNVENKVEVGSETPTTSEDVPSRDDSSQGITGRFMW